MSKINWMPRDVEGHQDTSKDINTLDRQSQLNTEADKMAKEHIHTAKWKLRHYLIGHEPWSLWKGEKKIIKNFSKTIYDIVHMDAIKQYWISKDRVTDNSFHHVHWEAIGKAITNTP